MAQSNTQARSGKGAKAASTKATSRKKASKKTTQSGSGLTLQESSLLLLAEDIRNTKTAYPGRVKVGNMEQGIAIVLHGFKVVNGEIIDNERR